MGEFGAPNVPTSHATSHGSDGSDPVTVAQPVTTRDPLRAELARCGAMGEAGGRDPACLHAWAENRRRFLGQPEPATSTAPTVSDAPATLFLTAPASTTPDQNGSR